MILRVILRCRGSSELGNDDAITGPVNQTRLVRGRKYQDSVVCRYEMQGSGGDLYVWRVVWSVNCVVDLVLACLLCTALQAHKTRHTRHTVSGFNNEQPATIKCQEPDKVLPILVRLRRIVSIRSEGTGWVVEGSNQSVVKCGFV